jgi:hypothetical protein
LDGTRVPATFEADAMHALLVLRADAIEGFSEGSNEEGEFAMISEALEMKLNADRRARSEGGKG